MPEASPDPNAYLASIQILTSGTAPPMALGLQAGRSRGAVDTAPRRLAAEAMRWTYVLRTRQRWLDKGGASQAHEADAAATLRDFGLSDAKLQTIARADRVVVRMPFASEAEGWAGRIFPWEYVIAAATRRWRLGSNHHFTVMRQLAVERKPKAPRWDRQSEPGMRMLFVQSAPADLSLNWEFDNERQRVRHAMGLAPITDESNARFRSLNSPTLQQLRDAVAAFQPDMIHLTGFDNMQGLRALRSVGTIDAPVQVSDRPFKTEALSTLLGDKKGVHDGFLLAGDHGGVHAVGAQALAQALSAQGRHQAYCIGVSVENSAARTAAMMVAEGASLASIAFQDSVDNALSNYFFELLYSSLSQNPWRLPGAFELAWQQLRQEPNATRATGIALWAGEPLFPPDKREVLASTLPERPDPTELPRIVASPYDELNYSVLHNNGSLFKEFVVERGGASPGDWLTVDVEIHMGSESARYSKRFQADKRRFDLSGEIHMPLTSTLVRSTHEAINSSLRVQLSQNDTVLTRDSHRLRLLPVDQWRDNDRDGHWLPSFVLPRDPAVLSVVEQAQRYVRVLRDNPDAGFEGYQAAPQTDEYLLHEVDLQVQAIWATLVHEWRLAYINPPPTYSRDLDSQRLRTPSAILNNRSGTCIDLALLFAACLELIDIYPVIFLLKGHALPGYWRHNQFQDRYAAVKLDIGAMRPLVSEAERNSSSSSQDCAWQAQGKAAYQEVLHLIRDRQLVPVETVRLTEHCGFVEAIESGVAAMNELDDFHSVLDIVTARGKRVTPLPITGETP